MPRNALGEVLRFIACLGPGDVDRTDRELVEQFIVHQEESAFAFLVRRHGPMVFHVCRRILGNSMTPKMPFKQPFSFWPAA